ncbi:unnamed protein product [Sphacelaria rigidula]
MAAAISSMENGNRLPVSREPPSRSSSLTATNTAGGNSRRSSRVQSRSPSSSSLTSSRRSDSGDLSDNSRRISISRVTTTTPPSPTRSGGSGGTGVVSPGVGGGVWASLLSLGAAALPSSLLTFSANTSSSSAPPSPRARRRSRGRSSAIIAVARARAGSGGGTVPRRLSRQQRPLAAAAAAAAASSSSRSFSLLSLPSSAATAPAPSPRLARSTAAAAPGPAAEAAGSGDVEAARIQDGLSPNGLGAENGSREERGRSTGVRVATAAVVAGTAAPAVVVAAKASRSCGKTSRGKKVYLEGGGKVYTCACCRAHLATRDHVVSECFHGHGGRAFLFERCANVSAGKPENRMLMTGMHVVADIKCTSCGAELGWKYDSAADAGQKYKEGKFILERCAVTLEGCDGDGYSDGFSGRPSSRTDNRYGYGYGPEYGSDGCGSRSGGGFVAWGADHAPTASGGHW